MPNMRILPCWWAKVAEHTAFFRRSGERLLTKNIFAGRECIVDELEMRLDRRCYDHGVDIVGPR